MLALLIADVYAETNVRNRTSIESASYSTHYSARRLGRRDEFGRFPLQGGIPMTSTTERFAGVLAALEGDPMLQSAVVQLVAKAVADEREACAKILQSEAARHNALRSAPNHEGRCRRFGAMVCFRIAEIIRARGVSA